MPNGLFLPVQDQRVMGAVQVMAALAEEAVVLVVAPAEVMVEHNLTTDVNNDKMTDYKKKLERIFDEQYKNEKI
jgi:hypothetical protein